MRETINIYYALLFLKKLSFKTTYLFSQLRSYYTSSYNVHFESTLPLLIFFITVLHHEVVFTFYSFQLFDCVSGVLKMEEKLVSDLSSQFAKRTEREAKALHFRVIRFMFESGILIILNSILLNWICNQSPRPTQLPTVGRIGQSAVILCGLRVKAGILLVNERVDSKYPWLTPVKIYVM